MKTVSRLAGTSFKTKRHAQLLRKYCYCVLIIIVILQLIWLIIWLFVMHNRLYSLSSNNLKQSHHPKCSSDFGSHSFVLSKFWPINSTAFFVNKIGKKRSGLFLKKVLVSRRNIGKYVISCVESFAWNWITCIRCIATYSWGNGHIYQSFFPLSPSDSGRFISIKLVRR